MTVSIGEGAGELGDAAAEREAAAAVSMPLNEEPFPRGLGAPRQSPLFWVSEKDRYLRQLMIRDIERITSRRLIVYFADCERQDPGAQILTSDDVYMAELLGSDQQPADLLIETDGGSTDATEKLVALLREMAPDLRVVVPRRAKSNGTLLALAAARIVMGATSELGPIDPFVDVDSKTRVPAHALTGDGVDSLFQHTARNAISQTRTLARALLASGMLRDRPADIEPLVDKLANREHYHSHGSVIDAAEAERLGLTIDRLSSDDPLWAKLWLLRCMYAHDLRANGHVKIFEGRIVSNTLRTVETRRTA